MKVARLGVERTGAVAQKPRNIHAIVLNSNREVRKTWCWLLKSSISELCRPLSTRFMTDMTASAISKCFNSVYLPWCIQTKPRYILYTFIYCTWKMGIFEMCWTWTVTLYFLASLLPLIQKLPCPKNHSQQCRKNRRVILDSGQERKRLCEQNILNHLSLSLSLLCLYISSCHDNMF